MSWLTKRPNPETDAIAAYWDALVDQHPAVPVPPSELPASDGALIRQLHAEEAHGSLPVYQDELLQRLLATYKEEPSMTSTNMAASLPQSYGSPPARNGSRIQGPTSRRRVPAPHARSGWTLRPAVAVGLAILLVLASVGGVWLTTSRNDEPHRLLAPVVATPSADDSPDVPMYRANPERTGVMPGPGIDGQPVELWRSEIGGSIKSSPAVVDGVLYIGAGDGGVYAFDTATGEEIWQFTGSSAISSAPAVVNGIVYVGSDDGTLYAIDAVSGTERWSRPGARQDASVVVVDGTLYTGSKDGFLYALNAGTGEEIWSAPLNAEAARSPAVSDGVVYQGSADSVLHTFDAATGEPGWAVELRGNGVLPTTVVTGGVVYQGTFDGEENIFFALDAATGEEIWSFESESVSGFYSAATDGETVYTATGNGVVYALDTATGEERWQVSTGDTFGGAPAIVGDTLYIAGGNGVVYTLDADTGAEQWRFQVEGAVDNVPVVLDGVAYLGTSFGYVYAIGGNGEPVLATPAATPAVTPEGSVGAMPVASPDATPVAAQDMAVELAWQSTGGPDPLLAPAGLAFNPDGNLWVTDTGNNRFQIFSTDGDHLETWGEAGDGDGEFNFYRTPNNPGEAVGDIAFAPDGSFYVSSAGDKRIQHFSADREFLRAWGTEGEGDGQFLDPFGIAVGPEGNVYVIDDFRNDIQVFDPEGTYLFTFGEPGKEPGQLFDTGALAIDADGNVWVADWGNNRIQQFAPDGTFLTTFGKFGRGDGQFINPEDLAIDRDGNVYVPDPNGSRIQVFTPDGEFLLAWSAADEGQGALTAPLGIAVDANGGVYVADIDAGTVQKFEVTLPETPATSGEPASTPAASGMATFRWETASGADSNEMGQPGPVAVAPDGTIWLTDSGGSLFHLYTSDGAYIESWGTPGQGEGEFDFAMSTNDGDSYGGIAFAPDGSFYVADTGNMRIQHFSADRQFLGTWGEFGPNDGQFLKPLDVVVDSQGNVFVIDELRAGIQKFDATGTHLQTFGSSGSAEGQFDFVAWIAIDASDSIWVADSGNGRIQQFDNDGVFVTAFDGNGALVEPWEVAVDATGAIYVADIGAGQVVVLDPSGSVIGTWGNAGDGPGELHHPAVLTLDGRGNVLVVDYLSDTTWEGRLVVYQIQPPGTGTEATPPPN